MQQPAAGYSQASATAVPVGGQAPEGNIGAAWRDITGTPGWLKRVLVLCLVGCVPILNFAVDGYCIRWARELSFGKRDGLPKAIFKKREISTGFFAVLVSTGLGLACGIVITAIFLFLTGLFGVFSAAAAGIIAVVLIVAFVIFGVLFLSPVVDACIMRMSVVGYLESGFNVKVVWSAFRKNMGGLMGASILPRLIVGIVSSLVVGVIFAVLMAIVGAAGSSIMSGGNPMGMLNSLTRNPQMAYSAIMGASYLFLFILLVISIISSMFTVFSTLLTYRSVGHWVARIAPEWASESDEGLGSNDSSGVGLK